MSIGVMLFCPFTGKPRHPSDIQSDPKGILVWDGEEPLRAYIPPAQRTWVGLTDKEIGVLWFEANDQDNSMIKHFARAIEAKLRSKNEDRN